MPSPAGAPAGSRCPRGPGWWRCGPPSARQSPPQMPAARCGADQGEQQQRAHRGADVRPGRGWVYSRGRGGLPAPGPGSGPAATAQQQHSGGGRAALESGRGPWAAPEAAELGQASHSKVLLHSRRAHAQGTSGATHHLGKPGTPSLQRAQATLPRGSTTPRAASSTVPQRQQQASERQPWSSGSPGATVTLALCWVLPQSPLLPHVVLLGVGQQAPLRLAHRAQHQRLALLRGGSNPRASGRGQLRNQAALWPLATRRRKAAGAGRQHGRTC